MYDSVIYLVSYEDMGEKDDYGDDVMSEIRVPVFASVKSVGMKEFYQAQTVDLKPEIVFEISDYLSYNEEDEVIYENKRYKVLRTYRKTTNQLEITCYGGVRDECAQVGN